MDDFLPLISTTDTKMRVSIGAKILSYVLDPSNSVVCSDIGLFIDQMIVWLRCSNHKVVLTTLDILVELVNRMRADFHPYLPTLLPHLVDKLEDSKEVIREKTSFLVLKLVDAHVIQLQALFDRISTSCFTHKNSNVREQIMYLLCTALDTYGTSGFTISKFVPSIVKLLSDPHLSVRVTAMDTLCKIYKHVGERLRSDLLKKNLVPINKLSQLLKRFDEIKATADDGLSDTFKLMKVSSESVAEHVVDGTVTRRPPVTPSMSAPRKIVSATKMTVSNGPQTGGVDEETFHDSFEKVPALQVYSARDVDDHLRKCHQVLEKDDEDWNKRVDCLKKIRSLMIAGGLNYDEFYDQLNVMSLCFQGCIKDLRSMVVREACITVAYLSKNLEIKFDHFAGSVLNSLINLIQNSKKVIASSGLVCIRFILRHTHAPRLVPIIANNLNSKSKDIRRACCEFIAVILESWEIHTIERHVSVLQDAIKKGISDADPDARAYSRQAYEAFAQHFPDQAECLKNSLDITYRKMLLGGSNTSLNTAAKMTPRTIATMSLRSNSAIDLQAVKRAKTRAQYSAMARHKLGTGQPVYTPQRTKPTTPITNGRTGRTKSRISISQPTSRSGSPSSRYSSYSHYLATRSRKSSVGNDASSRETSPNRSFGTVSPYGFKSRYASTQPTKRPIVAQKILQQSREAETALADALGDVTPFSVRVTSRGLHRTLEDHSDESETSSMCSEHSFDSYRRTSDSMSWNGSQHRLYHDGGGDSPLKDINEIIACCESVHWNDRKRGLMSLQYYIQDGNKLELHDLKKIMETFLKIFNDPHIKVFSLFLDALNELVLSHSEDLLFCLHLLLTRLFNKLGTDLLTSTHSKIMKTLDNVYCSFPRDLQIQCVFRFLIDPTQTPNNRVKAVALSYLIKLTTTADPNAPFSPTTSASKDYAALALCKIISWVMPGNAKSTSEVRKLSQEALTALYVLNPSQIERRVSTMPSEYRETMSAICKNSSNALHVENTVDLIDLSSPYQRSSAATAFESESNKRNGRDEHSPDSLSTDNLGEALKDCLDQLNQTEENERKKELLSKLTTLVQRCPSDALITNFKPLLGRIVAPLSSTETSAVKQLSLGLLQTLIERKTVTFLLKNFSDLVITKTIALSSDPCKDVTKASENCALLLATHLPAESVIRIIVPLISETAAVKLVALKMLTRLVETTDDDAVLLATIDQIMPLLLNAYDDLQSAIRKAVVFCVVALYKHSDEMKACLRPYIEKLQGAKLKLVELYIQRAEEGSSMPISPRTS